MRVEAITESSKTGPSSIRMPLRLKITLPYLILAVLLAAGATYIVNRIIFDSVEERFTNQLIESGKLASEQMLEEEIARLESMRLLANTVGISEALANNDAELLRNLVLGITASQQEELVDFLNHHGVLTLSIRQVMGGSGRDYQFTTGGGVEYLAYDFIRNVLLQENVKRYEKTAGLVRLPWGNYFLIAGPIYAEDGSLSGVLLIGKSIQRLVQEMHQSTLTHISFYDDHGQVLASTLQDLQEVGIEKASTVLASQNRYSMLRELVSASIEYQEIFGPWEVRYSEDLGIIGAALPKTFLVRTSAITRANIMLLVFLTFFLIVIVGVNLANYITEPLLSLLRATQSVAQGDLKIQVPVTSTDEIASLTTAFNRMVTSLYRSKRDLVEAYDRTIEGWVRALELRDEETQGHSSRVVEMTMELARRLDIPESEMEHIKRGVLLHDIGKMVIPDEILLETREYTPEQREVMLKHPEYAYEMLGDIDYLRPALDIPLYHHERWNGSGYPRGLKNHSIPFPARIFAVVDVFDAMTNHRRYRRKIPQKQAIEHIRQNSGILFDPQVVQAFLVLTEERGSH